MSSSRSRIQAALAAMIFAMMIAVVPFISYSSSTNTWERLAVNAAKVCPGMTISEVTTLLGTPTSRTSHPLRPDNPVSHDTFKYSPPAWICSFWNPWRWNPNISINFDDGRVRRISHFPDANIPFNSEDWKRSHLDRRGCMAKDLLKKNLLEGKTRDEIVAVLGPPEESRFDLNGLRYHLGHYLTKNFDQDLLRLVLDMDGRVALIEIVH